MDERDDERYFCADCLTCLGPFSEETDCHKCGKAIETTDDSVDEKERDRRVAKAERDYQQAKESGLFK